MSKRTQARTLSTLAFAAASAGFWLLPGITAGALTPGVDRIAVPFVENAGQAPTSVRFMATTFGGTVSVMHDGALVYVLPGDGSSAERVPRVLTERLRASNAISPRADRPAATNVSYLLGADRGRWRPHARTYDGIDLGEAWPGVRVSLRARGSAVEKVFTVAPNADAGVIRVAIEDAAGLTAVPTGELRVATPSGTLVFSQPIAYQEIGGVRRHVEVAYRLLGHDYGFALGAYDTSHPLVIDPFLQATYASGAGGDDGLAMALDPATGEVLVSGGTLRPEFPGATEITRATLGRADVFIARLNADLTALIQMTYYGDGMDEAAFALAVHPVTGNVYFGGRTRSQLPGTGGGAQPLKTASQSGFIAVLDSSMTTLLQSTYLSGGRFSLITGLAVHPASGDVYATGYIEGADFPETATGAQPMLGGGRDAFVARLNAGLTSVVSASYMGGPEPDSGMALAIAPTSGDVYVAGDTYGGLPFTAGGAQSMVAPGATHAFVARFDPTLATAQVTYVSGSTGTQLLANYERSGALVIHPASGEVYVAGLSRSDDHPAVGGGAQETKNAFQDAFVTRLDPGLTTFLQSTYFGGNDRESARGLGFDPVTGDVYLIGHTTSTDLPGVSCGAQPALNGLEDGFVARFNQALTQRTTATYLGGSRRDNPLGGAVHQTTGDVYVVGATDSTDFPATAGGANPVSGGIEAFAIRLTLDIPADCNGDGVVSIAEMITGVNIALGSTPLSACPTFDADGDGMVSIAELIRAVTIALFGCP